MRFGPLPPEEILIDDFHYIPKPFLLSPLALYVRQARTDLDDPVLHPREDVRVSIPDEGK